MMQTIQGRHAYVAAEELTRTANAIIYGGFAIGSGEPVILKLIENAEPDRQELYLLKRVMDAHAGGPHHVMHLLDSGAEGRELWLVLEYFDDTLLSLDPGQMTAHALMNIAIGSAKGLVEMEQAGVVDYDIKPANIAFEREGGRVAHIDLGGARLRGQKPLATTEGYASPEAMDGQASDTAPIYSWARTMRAMCGGYPALESFERLDGIVPWVGKAFAGLVVACEQADPLHRPGAAELYARVKELVREKRRCGQHGVIFFPDGECPDCVYGRARAERPNFTFRPPDPPIPPVFDPMKMPGFENSSKSPLPEYLRKKPFFDTWFKMFGD